MFAAAEAVRIRPHDLLKCLNSLLGQTNCARCNSELPPAVQMVLATRCRPSPTLSWEISENMTKITFIQPDGAAQTVDAENGLTVMEAAKLNDIAGIEAECGGACACATCHVYVDEAFRAATGKPAAMEEDMLDFAFDVRDGSRLCCQIKITSAIDGLVVRVPAKQF